MKKLIFRGFLVISIMFITSFKPQEEKVFDYLKEVQALKQIENDLKKVEDNLNYLKYKDSLNFK